MQRTLERYGQLLRGEISGADLWRELRLLNQLGVTRGQLETAPPVGLGIPAATESGRYSIAITAGGAAAFTATATAQGAQAQDTRCASFSINQAGKKTAASAGCWD